jgi:polysaccharide export outer membrane protein
MRPWLFRCLCLLLAFLTACSTPRAQYAWHDLGPRSQPESPGSPPESGSWGAAPESGEAAELHVGPGYLVALRFMGDRALNGDFRVDFDGTLSLPYNVSVNAAGLTVPQLKKKLSELYHPYFKTSSDIDVRVKERKAWLDVRGLVLKPGRFLVDPDASLDQVISAAGGAAKDPSPQSVRIQKGGKSFSLNLNQYYSRGETRPLILGWLGGEVLFLQKEPMDPYQDKLSSSLYRNPVYMLGEVRKPGEYTPRPGADFVDFLVMADGFTDRANLDRLQVIRRSGGRLRSYEFSWDEFEKAPAPLQGDVLIVHADQHTFERRVAIATLLISMITAATLIIDVSRTHRSR